MKNNAPPSKIQELAYICKVEEAMTDEVITVTPDTTMSDVRKILKEKRISGLPVIGDEKLVGIISTERLIKCIMNGKADEPVKENMTSIVQYIYRDEPLINALRAFNKHRYGRLPVIENGTEKLVGILTKGDIIRCLLKKLEINYQEEENHRYTGEHIFEDIKSERTTVTLRYEIKGGEYKVAGEQSGYLKANLIKLGIPPKITRRITIASCEAEMNIIIFTDGGELIARVEEDKIKVNAIDKGPGIPDIEKAFKPGYSTAPDWVREMGFGAGMGLPNIKNCTDEVRIESKSGEGTNLEFIVYLGKK